MNTNKIKKFQSLLKEKIEQSLFELKKEYHNKEEDQIRKKLFTLIWTLNTFNDHFDPKDYFISFEEDFKQFKDVNKIKLLKVKNINKEKFIFEKEILRGLK